MYAWSSVTGNASEHSDVNRSTRKSTRSYRCTGLGNKICILCQINLDGLRNVAVGRADETLGTFPFLSLFC